MTVPELKAELRKRNLTTAGKKADLIKRYTLEIFEVMIFCILFFMLPWTNFAIFFYRLLSYDRNQSFGADCDTQEDAAYLCPPSEMFRDINADTSLPMITRQEIQEYFIK